MDHGDMPPMTMNPTPPMPMTPDSMYNSSSDMKDMVMMHISFFWGKDVTVLFEGWPNGRLGMYILALVFVFVLSVAVEVLSLTLPAAKTGANPVVTSSIHAAIYAVRMVLSYMVMLSVMSFNLGIFIVAVVGHALGHFVVKLRTADSSVPSPGDTSSDGYPKH